MNYPLAILLGMKFFTFYFINFIFTRVFVAFLAVNVIAKKSNQNIRDVNLEYWLVLYKYVVLSLNCNELFIFRPLFDVRYRSVDMVSRGQQQYDDDGSTKIPASRTEMVEMKKPSNKKQKVNEEEEKEQQQGNNTTTTTPKSTLSIPAITTTTASMTNSRSGQQKSDRQRVSDLESKAREILAQESERDRLARKKRRRTNMDKCDACCAECGIGCADCFASGDCPCVIQ